MAKLLVQGGMKTIALAPETGSDSLRIRVNKCVTNAQILAGCRILIEAGIQNLKMYFIYGFPFEEDSDLQAIVDLVREIGNLGTGKGSLRISLNPFIPKSFTPFEASLTNYLSPKMPELNLKYQFLEKQLLPLRQVKLETLDLDEAYLQTIISIADTRLTDLLVQCSQLGPNQKKWFTLFRKNHELLIKPMLKTIMDTPFGEHYWNLIDQGFKSSLLHREYILSKEGKSGLHCSNSCSACGVCSDLNPKDNDE
jgi:radical SAM superfamily enzyme YgiQ (UPF0313 family)